MHIKNIENFLILNPWRNQENVFQKKYHSRWLFDRVMPWIDHDDILVILGPRQVGKTTLLSMLMKHLIEQKQVSCQDIFYFNAEDPLLQSDFFANYVDLYSFIKSERKGKAYVFIDEAQKISNVGIFLKSLYDLRDSRLQLIVTGSSTLELKQKIQEPLTGRKKVFYLNSLSFKEYLEFKTGKSDWISHQRNPVIFQEFITYGGYPRVALAKNDSERKAELHEIYSSYLQKDVKDFLKIENPNAFNQLLRILSDQTGNLMNVHELSNTIGINRLTLEKYLTILEDTFVIHRLTPFYSNARTEITKMPKVYFLDNGLRNFIAGNLAVFPNRSDVGKVAENFVFTEYFKSLQDMMRLHFWRTQNKAEVDFVYVYHEKEIYPIEVKYGADSRNIPGGLRSFIEAYKPKEAIIFSREGSNHTQPSIDGTSILHFPLGMCGLDNVAASFALPFHQPLS